MTPASTSSRVLISAVAEHLGIGNAGQTIVGRWVIDRSGVTVYDNVRASGNGQLLATNIYDTVPLLYVDSPNTVSSITYKIRFARAASSGTGSIFFNDGNAQSSMAMIEYAP